jgi:hypothetical protein
VILLLVEAGEEDAMGGYRCSVIIDIARGWHAHGQPGRRFGHRQGAMAAPRAEKPGASMRACSYHASPGACQANALCISLWMISVNTLVCHCTAVDERGCGKVDNYGDVRSRASIVHRRSGVYSQASLWRGEPAFPSPAREGEPGASPV